MAYRIPREFLDQLLSRVDVVEVIDRRLPLRKAGRDYNACCPFHTEKTPSFTVSPVKQFYHCFGCGAHGNAIGFLMAYERMGFLEATEELAHLVGLELPHGVSTEQDDHGYLIDLVEQANHFFRRQLHEHPAREKAGDYLRTRGLTREIVTTFGIGYAPPGWDSLFKALTAKGFAVKDLVKAGLVTEQDERHHRDRFRDRLTFPIRDRRGRVIAFGARALGDNKPKYLNSPETPFFHKGRELYGLFEARKSQQRLKCLAVVEGYMDVVALAQHDIPYAVATLGTATTPDQVERLFRATPDIVFCFDGDQAGREAAWRALENTLPQLRNERQASFLFLPEGEDPDSLVRKEGTQSFEQRLSHARPLSEYFFERLSVGIDMNSIDGRARLFERARPLIDKLPDCVYRDLMVQRLAEITGSDKNILEKRFSTSVTAPPVRSKHTNPINPTRTLIRKAIALLLNRNHLAQRTDDLECFRGIDVPGLPLLMELIELLKNNPHINTGTLIERYRNTATQQILERLASWQPEIPEHLMEAEFLGVLEKLKKLYVEKQLFDKIARGEIKLKESEMLRNPEKIP